MSRVIAVVEGQTEQGFVRDVLAPFLATKNVNMAARLVGKPGHKGGDCRYPRAKRDVLLLLRQESATVVTTMFDFYALPDSWPGRTEAKKAPFCRKADIVETAVKKDILGELGTSFDERRFCPYIQMHEFEALLFSNPDRFAQEIQRVDLSAKFRAIREEFQTPEDINDSPETAPSKRIENLFPRYEKPLFGVLAVVGIGLPAIRLECPHFNDWLNRLEALPGVFSSQV